MPIRPERAALYPGGSIRSKEWRAFRAAILDRAGNACEGTDQFPTCRAANGGPHPETGSKVVLTIAHMDHDETHADPERCRALCQRCHNAWDREHRRQNAYRKTRQRKAQIDIEDWIRKVTDPDPTSLQIRKEIDERAEAPNEHQTS